MVVQHVINPNEVCPEIELYYRIKNDVQITEKEIYMSKGAELSTDTYMNIFDSAAWGKYTDIKKWSLRVYTYGKGRIQLKARTEHENKVISSHTISSDEETEIIVPFELKSQKEMYYFQITASDVLHIKRAYFIPEDKVSIRDIHIGIVICTYKRNKEVYRTLDTLKKSEFFNNKSNLYGKMSIRIVDNASELPKINEPYIELFHNKNTGGSGGFTRGIVETRKQTDQYGITNVVLMDDDVEVIPETFYRLYALLSLMTQEYQNEVIAGRMFRLEERHIQYTAAEIWNTGNIKHIGFDLDMRKTGSLSKLNDSRNAEYSGWWFACFQIEFIKENLPLPFFLHCDDVEYGLRHGGTPIILNGIQVWHESFERRMSPIVTYFDTRNSLIVNDLYGLTSRKEKISKEWKEKITIQHAKKNYLTERMIILALWDYCKGIQYCLNGNATNKYQKLYKKKRVNRYVNSIMWRMAEWKFKNIKNK